MFVDCGYKVNAGTWNDSTDKLRSLFPTITFHEKRVSGFEFIEFMKRSRVVVTHKIVPSFNQSAHQAMWCRIPSVGTVSGYQIDLYPNLTVDVGCVMKQFVKIQKVITDDRFANKHTEIALIRAEEFSVENAVQEFTRIIHCLGGRHA